MVAENVQVEDPAAEGETDSATKGPEEKDAVPQLMASLMRVADLQFRIWMVRLKSTGLRLAMYFALFGAAMALGFLAIVFLYIGGFKVLTDVLHMRAVWAFVLFGGVHLLGSVVLIWLGTKMLTGKDSKKKTNKTEKVGL